MALLDSHIFGTLEVNDGATYAVCRAAFGALEPTDALLRWLAGNNDEDSFGGVAYKDQVHALTILVQATSTALLNDALSSLRAAAHSGVRWNVLLYGHDTPVWAQVSSVVSNIPAYVPNQTQYTVELKVTTRPGWRGAWADGQWATVSGLWGYADIVGIGGTMPADTAVWLATQQAAQVFGWGLRSAPVTGYLPLQDYSGTATANAKGQTSDLVDMTASFQTVGAPASLDADAHRTPTGRAGRYAVFARWKQDAATDANTTLRASSLVTGVGMTRTTSIPTGATPATAAVPTASGFEVANLGVVSIPCTNVPAAHSGVGYADETALVDQATAGTTVTIRADQEVARTLTWPGGRLTAIEITTEAAVSGSIVVALYAMPGSEPASRLLVATQALTAAGTYKIPVGPLELAAGTYAVGLSGLALTMTGGAVTDAAVDLFFREGSGTWRKETAPPSKINDLEVAYYAPGSLQVTGTAADEASIRRIHIQRATDSGFTADVVDDYTTFDFPPHIDSGLTPDTVYYYRAWVQDATGNYGKYSETVSATPAVMAWHSVQAVNASSVLNEAITETGTPWYNDCGGADYYRMPDGGSDGGKAYAEADTTKLSYSFTGTGIRWYTGGTAANLGIATVWIDGTQYKPDGTAGTQNFDMYSSSPAAMPGGTATKSLEVTGLSNASHTIEIRNTHTKNAGSANYFVATVGFAWLG